MTLNGTDMEFSEAFKEAKERMTVPQLWEKLGLPGECKKKCQSPFSEGSQDSFSLSKADRYWKDHRIGKGGDIFDFYQLACQCSKPEATKAIFDMLHLKANNPGYGWCKPPPKPAVVSLTGKKTLEPIEWVPTLPEDAIPFLLSKGINPTTAKWLLREGSLDVEGGKLVFVYNTGKKMRCSWESSKDNRWIEGGAEDALWRYEQVLRPEVTVVLICEGESDCMRVLSCYGKIPPHVAVVCAPAASWRPSPILASTIGHGRKVVLAFDNDEAGEQGCEKVGKILEDACYCEWHTSCDVRRFPWSQIEKVLNVLAAERPKDICCLPQNILHMALDSCFEPA